MICFIYWLILLIINQFGFWAEQNTSDALTQLLDKGSDVLQQKRVSLTFFLDFSKAFDIELVIMKFFWKTVLLWIQMKLSQLVSLLLKK